MEREKERDRQREGRGEGRERRETEHAYAKDTLILNNQQVQDKEEAGRSGRR